MNTVLLEFLRIAITPWKLVGYLGILSNLFPLFIALYNLRLDMVAGSNDSSSRRPITS